MKIQLVLVSATILFLYSCGAKKESGSLDAKKAQLTELQKKQDAITSQIIQLQQEIDALDSLSAAAKVGKLISVQPLD
jgi:peptidoglycan hydrolase CwlO-like protein